MLSILLGMFLNVIKNRKPFGTLNVWSYISYQINLHPETKDDVLNCQQLTLNEVIPNFCHLHDDLAPRKRTPNTLCTSILH